MGIVYSAVIVHSARLHFQIFIFSEIFSFVDNCSTFILAFCCFFDGFFVLASQVDEESREETEKNVNVIIFISLPTRYGRYNGDLIESSIFLIFIFHA